MSVFITGDTHGTTYLKKLLPKAIKIRKQMKNGDTVIITGDFGLIFKNNDFRFEEKYLSLLEEQDLTFCFIDGDRDNLKRILKYETVQWHGASAKKIRSNIFYLMRGNVYTIENKTFLCLGGGSTPNTELLIKDKTWWDDENITQDDIKESFKNLKNKNNNVDFILTHVAPQALLKKMHLKIDESKLYNERVLNVILENVIFHKWIFGHYHVDRIIDDKYYCVFKRFLKIT